MKTYILKRFIYNTNNFPIGTIVTITDDYWGKSFSDKNTGFTVVEGELKGKKGCVINGLNGWIIDDTEENRTLIQKYVEQQENLRNQIIEITEQIENIPNSELDYI